MQTVTKTENNLNKACCIVDTKFFCWERIELVFNYGFMNFCFIWTDFAFACAGAPLPPFRDFWIRLIKLFYIFIIRTSGIKRADILFRCKTNLVWKKFWAKFCSSLPGSSISCSNVQVNLKITWKAWLTSVFLNSDLNLLIIYTFFLLQKVALP